MSDDATEQAAAGTWVAAVDAFEADATWLSGVDQPQLTALRAIAEALDAGSFQAALISQFTLIHRGLLARQPDSGREKVDETEQIIDMMENNPGAFWKPQQ